MKDNKKMRKVCLNMLSYEHPTYTKKLMNVNRIKRDSGVYVFVDELTDVVYYVGVTTDLKERIGQHTATGGKHSLYKFLLDKHSDSDIVKKKLSNINVKFWVEDNLYLQDLYEKHFILTLKPTFNVSRYTNSRSQESSLISFEDKVKTIQLLGR